MKQRTTKRFYLLLLTLFSLFALFDAIGGITQQQAGVEVMQHLGYPAYMMVILGVAKIFGLVAIIQSKYETLKEWAYAGFAFNFMGASVSRMVISDPFFESIFPLIMLGILLTIYFLWKKSKLAAPGYAPAT